MTDHDAARASVRAAYARAAGADSAPAPTEPASGGCCGPAPTAAADAKPAASGCCGEQAAPELARIAAERLGYGAEDLGALSEGANLGLGCGNPTAIAALEPGQTVVDLGSGGGFDCFLAARAVGPEGRVIGIDMTPEMLSKARTNARKLGLAQVEFRLGEIEALPVADGTVDVILSNCVVNLSPDKPRVLRECFRILRPGGRLQISDTVAVKPLPEAWTTDEHMMCGCMGGAALVTDLERWLTEAGFAEVSVAVKEDSRDIIADWAPGTGVEDYVLSADITAVKA
ncbi:SAM-dependent methyltransferase [Caenispirillum salinarum AK4]|uniref:Arsenite methyltransferase n=1 Tax=Caenispirillum salinarum AK4 TaxID=1238182 RepID=K9GU79_9PROT|nr:arsenite methyltransferase [Caenispirillum salinarum]EKV28707.1 SAM-dependent methyltransferase [Caenispirillum salinarum AK4]